jgi:hypothetical protein
VCSIKTCFHALTHKKKLLLDGKKGLDLGYLIEKNAHFIFVSDFLRSHRVHDKVHTWTIKCSLCF